MKLTKAQTRAVLDRCPGRLGVSIKISSNLGRAYDHPAYEVGERVEFMHYDIHRWVLGTVVSCPSWAGPNTASLRWEHCLGSSVDDFNLHRVRRASAIVQLGNLGRP